MENSTKNFKIIQNHLKQFGFIFPGSEIYGGLANSWDYGPLGVLIIQKLKAIWWNEFITKEPNNYALDSKILMNSQVWKASGHLKNFTDLLVEEENSQQRYRVDHLINEHDSKLDISKWSIPQLQNYLNQHIATYQGQTTKWGPIRHFQLMFETYQGVIKDQKQGLYLRPETAQGIFVNFKNVQRAMRAKLPLGIGQIGKSFRNEITPGNYIFRTREFEQMELEVFVDPQTDEQIYQTYVTKCLNFVKKLGLKSSSIRLRVHLADELAHYAKAATDVEFQFPFGWGELLGIANRTNFDLKAHMQHSQIDLTYRDPQTNQVFLPYVIEPSMGLDRLLLALLVDAYDVEQLNDNEERIVLKLNPDLAPYRLAILPLNKKAHATIAYQIFKDLLAQGHALTYDHNGSIGKRYRRQDAIGTPYVVTIIDQTVTDNLVTIRFRDSRKQITIALDELKSYL